MQLNRLVQFILFFICCGLFIFGLTLFYEASQPCGSDSCLAHVLYFIAVPIMLVTGIVSYKLGKKLFTKTRRKKE